MSYNKVDPCLWNGGSFPRLSRLECTGQGLWLMLLTCPWRHSSGIFRIGKGAIEDLTGWTRERLEEPLAELLAERMVEPDWTAGVIRLVNAVKHYPPENANVAKSWRNHIESLPPCDVVAAHAEELKPLMERFGVLYSERFTERLAERYRYSPTPTPTPTQVPKVSSSKKLEPSLKSKKSPRGEGSKPNPDVKTLVSWYYSEFERVRGVKLVEQWGRDGKIMKDILAGHSLDDSKWAVTEFLERPEDWYKDKPGPNYFRACATEIFARRPIPLTEEQQQDRLALEYAASHTNGG